LYCYFVELLSAEEREREAEERSGGSAGGRGGRSGEEESWLQQQRYSGHQARSQARDQYYQNSHGAKAQ
jgi:hypothetical protein